MLKRKTASPTQRTFTWGIRSTELAIVQSLMSTEPLGGTADCGCAGVRPEEPRKPRTAARRLMPR